MKKIFSQTVRLKETFGLIIEYWGRLYWDKFKLVRRINLSFDECDVTYNAIGIYTGKRFMGLIWDKGILYKKVV